MALGVCRLFTSDWGISITVYASKVPESNNELFAYYAIVYAGRVMQSGRIEPPDAKPAEIQAFYAKEIIKEAEKIMRKNAER